MMKEIDQYLQSHPLPTNAKLASVTTYEVAQKPAKDQFEVLFNDFCDSCSSDDTIIFIHFGVHSNASTFLLEQFAWNEMDFRIPDQKGYQPSKTCITSSDGDLSHKKESTLPLIDIHSSLSSKHRFNNKSIVELSQDAGRFLCNYLYYISLTSCAQKNWHSLFVHVPPFNVIPKDTQLDFIHALLKEIVEKSSS